MSYVDGYVLPVPKKTFAACRAMARKAGRIWREHGALAYSEGAADDIDVKFGLPSTKLVKPGPARRSSSPSSSSSRGPTATRSTPPSWPIPG